MNHSCAIRHSGINPIAFAFRLSHEGPRSQETNASQRQVRVVVNRLSVLVLIVLAYSSLVPEARAQSKSEDFQPTLRSKLLSVHWPDTTALEPDVRDQLDVLKSSLNTALKDSTATKAKLAEAYGTTGQIFHAYSMMLPARECYVNANILTPQDFRWLYLLGKIDQQDDHVDDAIRRFREARMLRTDYLPLEVNLGNLFLQLDRLDDAKARFAAALTLDRKNAAAQYGLGQVALSLRRYAEAVTYFEAALKQVPDANRIHYSLAMAYRRLGDMDQAKTHMAQTGTVGIRVADPLFDRLPELVAGERVHLIRGRMALDAKRLEDAAAEFRKAIAAKPDSVAAHFNLATTLMQTKDYENAAAEFEAVLRLEPKHANAHYNLALLLATQGKHDQAIEYLRSLLAGNSDDVAARYFYAQELLKVDRRDEALAEFARVSRANPDNEEALLEEVKLLEQKKRYQEAVGRLTESFEAHPQRGQTAAMLAYFLAASPQYDLRNGARALDLARRVYQASGLPQHGALVAMALAELGRCTEAADWQRKMIALAEQQEQMDLATKLKSDLKLYEESQSCRRPGQ